MAHPEVIDLLSDSEDDGDVGVAAAVQNLAKQMAAPDMVTSRKEGRGCDDLEALIDDVLPENDAKDAKDPPKDLEQLSDQILLNDDTSENEKEPPSKWVAKSRGPELKSGPKGVAIAPSKTDKENVNVNGESTSEDEEVEPEEKIPEWDQIYSQCWSCQDPLKLSEGEFCLYATHAHPLWDTPCCMLCADDIAELQTREDLPSKNGENESADEEVCRGCAKTKDILLVCDTCEMDFCLVCLAKVHGGGQKGWKHVQTLMRSEETWECPVCQPPKILEELLAFLRQQQPEEADEERTAEIALDELSRLHSAVNMAQEKLDNIEPYRADIEEELGTKITDPTKLQTAVEEELSSWKEEVKRHLYRVQANESNLQDELVSKHGFDLSIVYERGLLEGRPVLQQGNPDWVQKADQELEAFYREKSQALPTDQREDTSDSEETLYEDVEELVIEDGVRMSPQRRTGYESKSKPSEKRLQRAMESEDTDHPELMHAPKATESDDLEETKREEETVSKHRIRRDQKVMVERRRRPRRLSNSQTHESRRTVDGARAATAGQRPSLEASSSNEQIDGAPVSETCRGAKDMSAGYEKVKKRIPVVSVSPSSAGTTVFTSSSRGRWDSSALTGDDTTVAAPGRADHKKFDLSMLHPELKDVLKKHQVEGIEFMWRNCFEDEISGGCVLAHNMGLGKTLTTLAFLHACMEQDLVKSVLIVVPVNTISSWNDEFNKWIKDLPTNSIILDDLNEAVTYAKLERARRFAQTKDPRILLVSHEGLLKVADEVAKADMVVIDEAHTPLKNEATKKYGAFLKMKSLRRVALTGTPIANHLDEYFNMIDYVRPGILGKRSGFEKNYILPITGGMASNSTARAVRLSDDRSRELYTFLHPFVHRKDLTQLKKDLPPLQHVVLNLRQTKMQSRMFLRYRSIKGRDSRYKNFFCAHQALSPISNHPATVLVEAAGEDKSDVNHEELVREYWRKLRGKFDEARIERVDSGNKFVALLHILVMAGKRNEKVLIFSRCLKTLDAVQKMLQMKDWQDHVPSLQTVADERLGGWKSGEDYVRIDGTMNSFSRSDCIDNFQTNDRARAFLLSVKAAGVGITLTAASRVVLMDTDFNPAVSQQAIFRAYRYGQTKPVFVYRFLTAGSMEEKVYARCVTKTGLSYRVIDQKTTARAFSTSELEDLQETLQWVQCDHCHKWRVLPDNFDTDTLPDLWYCKNSTDEAFSKCDDPEMDQEWYQSRASAMRTDQEEDSDAVLLSDVPILDSSSLVKRDAILESLLEVRDAKNSKIVTTHKFEEALLSTKDLKPRLEGDSSLDVSTPNTTPRRMRKTAPTSEKRENASESKMNVAVTKRQMSMEEALSTSPEKKRRGSLGQTVEDAILLDVDSDGEDESFIC